MKKLNTLKVQAFTLVEMLIVLLVISVLLLLFVPNLTKQKDAVSDTGTAAVVKVVESQPAARALRVGISAALIRPDTTCHLCHASCALCWAVRHGRNVSMKQCCCKPFHCAQHHD